MIVADRTLLSSVVRPPTLLGLYFGLRCTAARSVLGLSLPGCAVVGSVVLNNGRPAYNAVIDATADEQILSMIVRQRYDDTFGMLAVSSVTASLRIGASVGRQRRNWTEQRIRG